MKNEFKNILGVEVSEEIGLAVSMIRNGDYYTYTINFLSVHDGCSNYLPKALRNFKITASSNATSENIYAVEIETNSSISDAAAMQKALATFTKKYDAVVSKYGEIKTFGMFVNMVAMACGIKKVYWYDYSVYNDHRNYDKFTQFGKLAIGGDIVAQLDRFLSYREGHKITRIEFW